ncbi:MobF family relaxase [Thiomicrospira sp. WB1]|uniref:MobF family relaxase n=1 Tax=Thiomicrospira sp. WB1 TaxID=1685380 RepID=UPI00074B08F0|nr:MobF family relaxase [Thiomicrospira sp. WB1]KUJ72454.1 hypothetical protein AVO41_01180 [Thiomicrospira sp. WB1]
MMSTQNLTRNPQRIVDYLRNEKHGKSGDFANNQSANAFWLGKGAQELGLTGDVSNKDLLWVLRAEDKQCFNRRNQANTRYGKDITFSAPKSVSILTLCKNGDPRLMKSHTQAIRVAMGILEKNMMYARRRINGEQKEKAPYLIAAVFTHHDSRPVDMELENGQITAFISPQLHSHCLIANLAKNSRGLWQSLELDFGTHQEKQHLLSQVYKSTLRYEVHKLGYETYSTKDGFEISGITPENIHLFSARSRQIEEALAKMNKSRHTASSYDKALAVQATRQHKTNEQSDDLPEFWYHLMSAHDVPIDQLVFEAKRRQKEAKSIDQSTQIKEVQKTAVGKALKTLSPQKDAYSHAKLFETLLYCSAGKLSLQQAGKAIEEDSRIIRLPSERYTSKNQVRLQGEVAGFMLLTQRNGQRLCSNEEIEMAINCNEALTDMTLTDRQRQAIHQVLASTDQVSVLLDDQGSETLAALEVLSQPFESHGFELIHLSTVDSKLKTLLDAWPDTTVQTLDDFLLKGTAMSKHLTRELLEHQSPSALKLVVCHQAETLRFSQIKGLFDRLNPGDRLLLVGNPQKLKELSKTDSPSKLLIHQGIEHTHLNEPTKRPSTKNPAHKAILQNLDKGIEHKVLDGLKQFTIECVEQAFACKTRLENFKTRSRLVEQTLSNYWSLNDPEREKALLICGRSDTRQVINQTLAAQSTNHNQARSTYATIQTLSPLKLTISAKQDLPHFSPGLWVRSNSGKHRPLLKINSIDPKSKKIVLSNGHKLSTSQLKNLQFFKSRQQTFSLNQKVLFKGTVSAPLKKPVHGEIISMKGSDLQLSSGHTIDTREPLILQTGYCLSETDAMDFLEHTEVAHALIVAERATLSTAKTTQKALKQAQTIRVLTDNQERLEKAWRKWFYKTSASVNASLTHSASTAQKNQNPRKDRLIKHYLPPFIAGLEKQLRQQSLLDSRNKKDVETLIRHACNRMLGQPLEQKLSLPPTMTKTRPTPKKNKQHQSKHSSKPARNTDETPQQTKPLPRVTRWLAKTLGR